MNRHNRLRLNLALAPFAPRLGGLEICAFEAANNGSGDAGGGGAGGGGEMIPKSEADKAFKARDKAKAQAMATVGLFAQAMGIDPDEVRIEETGDKDNPYKLVGPNLEELSATLAEARKTKAGKGKWEDREKELVETHGRKVATLTKNHQRELSARDAWIEQQAVIDPIRSACVAEKAIDDDEGQFSDIVALLRPRVRVERSVDEESGNLNLKITVLGDDGKPMLDGKGNAATVRQLVADLLSKRPKYRQAQYRSGPGAGGNGSGSGQRESAENNGNGRPRNSASFMLGRA